MIIIRLALVSAVTAAAGFVTMPAAHADSNVLPLLDEVWKVVHQIVEEYTPTDTCMWLDDTRTEPEDAFVCAPTGPLVEGLLFDTIPSEIPWQHPVPPLPPIPTEQKAPELP